MTSTWISSSGLSVHRTGPEDGPTVVLLGGYGEPASAWEFSGVPATLSSAGTSVIWYAARGVAPSSVPSLPWSMSDLVDDLVGLLDEMGVPTATLVGYSLGGFTAELCARTHPDRVDGVVLIGSAGRPSAVAEALSKAEVEFAASGGVPAHFGRLTTLLTSLASEELCDGTTAGDWITMLDQLPSVWSSGDGELGQAQTSHDWIHRVQRALGPWPADVPVGVIAFEFDALMPLPAAREFAESTRGCQLRIIEGAAHGGLITRPAETIRALLSLVVANGDSSPRNSDSSPPAPGVD